MPRRAARTNATGDLVTMQEQDRSRWDHEMVAAGFAGLATARATGHSAWCGGLLNAALLERRIKELPGRAVTSQQTDCIGCSATGGLLSPQW